MPNITLSISKETKKRMEKHPHIKWSRAIRTIIERKLDEFEEAERLAKKSNLTMKDFEPISKKIKLTAGKRAEELFREINR